MLTLEWPIQASDDTRADVTAAVEELINSLSNKFAGVSSEMFAKSKNRRSILSVSKLLWKATANTCEQWMRCPGALTT
jgi:hypothetical protein